MSVDERDKNVLKHIILTAGIFGITKNTSNISKLASDRTIALEIRGKYADQDDRGTK